jgi:putative spermidine/putrescine transport system ATP-binding protein
MNRGKVEQFDTPVTIYDRPKTLFVNGFIGSTNLLPGKGAAVVDDTATVALDAGVTLRLPTSPGIATGSLVVLSVRPEQLVLSPVATADSWAIEPGLSLPLGSQLIHEARTVDGAAIKIVEPRRHMPSEVPRRFCALAADARPSLFPRSTPSATE